MFVASHGNPESFQTGFAWQDGGYSHPTRVYATGSDRYDIVGHPNWLSGVGVLNYRLTQMGWLPGWPWPEYTLPPYNSTEIPPISIAIVVSCCTGHQPEFESFCFPGFNAYLEPYMTNQAWAGFKVSLSTYDVYPISQTLYSSLVSGKTISQARSDLLNRVPPIFVYGTKTPLQGADFPIYGDPFARLETVYTGDNRSPVGWILP